MPASKRSAKSTQPAVIALDLGGTKLAGGLFGAEGPPRENRVTPLDGREGDEVGELVVAEARRLMKAAARRRQVVRAIGVSVPGIANPRDGSVWAPNIGGWEKFPLRARIKAAVDDATVKVVVDSDRSASIMGEVWQGAARGCRNAVFLAVGTGIGAGILVDGRVVRGADGIAGAIGWLALDRPFAADYVECGCFESKASGEGLAKVARSLVSQRKQYRGPLAKALKHGELTAHDVFAAYEDGDAVADEVLRQAIEFWGMASANLVSLLNPEKLILGGGVFGPAARFLDAIAAEAGKWAQPVSMRRVKFEVSELGSDAALYGAAFLALKAARMVVKQRA